MTILITIAVMLALGWVSAGIANCPELEVTYFIILLIVLGIIAGVYFS